MIEKVKGFFTALTYSAVLLYITGFLAEHGHNRLLGISTSQPLSLDYLIRGGEFFLALLFAIFSTLFSRLYYFVVFFIAAVLLLQLAAAARGKRNPKLSKTYYAAVILIILMLCFVVIPLFTSTFVFSDLLLSDREAGPQPLYHYLPSITGEIWTWILNVHDNRTNLQHLTHFFVLSLLAAAFSGVLLYSMWQIRKTREADAAKHETPGKSRTHPVSQFEQLSTTCQSYIARVHPSCFDFALGMLVILVVVQAIVIPVNYGILLKSNLYPVVRVDVGQGDNKTGESGQPGFVLLENYDPGSDSKLWLLRENKDELLLYATYFEKDGGDYPVFRLISVSKNQVRKIEMIDQSSVFKYK